MTQELRKLAEACLQDSAEWKWDGRKVDADGYVHIPECSYLVGAICLSDTYEGYQDHCEFIAAANPVAILALLDRVEKAEKDAARYQWLRTQHDEDEGMTLWHVRGDYGEPIEAYKLDEEIDAAMEASNDLHKAD